MALCFPGSFNFENRVFSFRKQRALLPWSSNLEKMVFSVRKQGTVLVDKN
jgi:hypothetical protein